MSEHEDRRANPRTAYKRPILLDFIVSDPEGLTNMTQEASGVDISKGGMGLRTGYPLNESDVLRLHIPIDVEETPVPVFAKVVWAEHAQGRYRAGLRFLS